MANDQPRSIRTTTKHAIWFALSSYRHSSHPTVRNIGPTSSAGSLWRSSNDPPASLQPMPALVLFRTTQNKSQNNSCLPIPDYSAGRQRITRSFSQPLDLGEFNEVTLRLIRWRGVAKTEQRHIGSLSGSGDGSLQVAA